MILLKRLFIEDKAVEEYICKIVGFARNDTRKIKVFSLPESFIDYSAGVCL